MSLNDTRISLFQYLETNWNSCDIIFEGQKTGDGQYKQANPWLYAEVDWITHSPRSIHNRTSTYVSTLGLFVFKLFVRESDGLASLDILTDSLNTLFHSRKIGNVIIDEVNIIHTELFQQWRVRHISMPFQVQTFENIP